MPRLQRRKALVRRSRRGRSAIEGAVRRRMKRAARGEGGRGKIGKRPKGFARKVTEPDVIVRLDAREDATRLPNIMTLWLEDPRYRDGASRPLRLKLNAPGASLAQLIRRVSPRSDVKRIARALVRSGAVQQHGPWYKPAGRFVSLRDEPQAALAHTLLSVRGLLRTLEYNLGASDAKDALLERCAVNNHIPVAALPTIHRFCKREADNLLARIDAYFRRWEVPAGSEPTVRVGFATFAFEDASELEAPVRQRG